MTGSDSGPSGVNALSQEIHYSCTPCTVLSIPELYRYCTGSQIGLWCRKPRKSICGGVGGRGSHAGVAVLATDPGGSPSTDWTISRSRPDSCRGVPLLWVVTSGFRFILPAFGCLPDSKNTLYNSDQMAFWHRHTSRI